jgi:hypothetical protein
MRWIGAMKKVWDSLIQQLLAPLRPGSKPARLNARCSTDYVSRTGEPLDHPDIQKMSTREIADLPIPDFSTTEFLNQFNAESVSGNLRYAQLSRTCGSG